MCRQTDGLKKIETLYLVNWNIDFCFLLEIYSILINLKEHIMNNKLVRSIVAGIAGTIVMTLFMQISPLLGLVKMDPPKMVADTLGMPIAVGWVMHFVIGIVFAAIFVFIFGPKVRISNSIIKGALFGIVAFILAQVPMSMMGDAAAPPEGSSMLMVALGGILGHVVFGIGVSLVANKSDK